MRRWLDLVARTKTFASVVLSVLPLMGAKTPRDVPYKLNYMPAVMPLCPVPIYGTLPVPYLIHIVQTSERSDLSNPTRPSALAFRYSSRVREAI